MAIRFLPGKKQRSLAASLPDYISNPSKLPTYVSFPLGIRRNMFITFYFILDEALFWFSRNILVISILLVFPTPDSIKYVVLFAGSFKLETETDLWNKRKQKKKKLTSEWARWRGRNQFCYKDSCWQWHNTQQTGLSSKKAIYHFNCQGRFTDFRHSLNQKSNDDVKTPSLGFVFLYVDFIPRQIDSFHVMAKRAPWLSLSSQRKSISSENNVKSPWEGSGLAE